MSAHVLRGALVGLLALQPFSAAAEDWSFEHQGWVVARSDDLCVMEMEYEGEGATRLTVFSKGDGADAYMTVTNINWSTEKGENYEIDFRLNGFVYSLKAIGWDAGVYKGFAIYLRDDFLRDLAETPNLKLERSGNLVDSLSMKGSSVALSRLKICRAQLAEKAAQEQRDRNRLSHIPKDPFADQPEE